MPSSARPSASIIVAAIIAILAGLLGVIMMSLGFFAILLGGAHLPSAQFPPVLRNIALGIMAFAACLFAFGIAIGVGLFLLRKWARLSILTWGGLSVFFGVFGGAVALLTPLAGVSGIPDLPPGAQQEFRVFILILYGLPTVVGAWWLFLFNRKNVKGQFNGDVDPHETQKARPPLPISVLAWLNITSAAHVLILPFLPFQMPLILFGHLFLGRAATGTYVLLCSILAFVGFGLLKLKRWSYSGSISLQLFFLASATVTALNPNYSSQAASLHQQLQHSMHLPTSPAFAPNPDLARWALFAGVFFCVAVIALLLYCRRAFLEAADRAASTPTNPVT